MAGSAGDGLQHEPYVKLLLHTGGELYVHNREPKVEVFALDDPYAREVEHLGAIRGEHPLAWDLADAAANTAVLEAMHTRRSASTRRWRWRPRAKRSAARTRRSWSSSQALRSSPPP